MAERQLPKLNVAGSIPVSRSKPLVFTHILNSGLLDVVECCPASWRKLSLTVCFVRANRSRSDPALILVKRVEGLNR